MGIAPMERIAVRAITAMIMLLLSAAGVFSEPVLPATNDQTTVILVIGAAGEPELGSHFAQWATNWQTACSQGNARCLTIGLTATNQRSDQGRLKELLQNESKTGPTELWLVFIGHGTFDGQEAKFNLRGPDLSATDLAAWMKPFNRPLVIIDTSSSSAPFLKQLSAPERVIITATSSGYEQNYARFGEYLSEAIRDPQADLDKDGQTSLLEAFLTAANHVAEFYRVEGRLATEHALLDDNGDGLGTPAQWFRGLRATKKASDNAALDGFRAHQVHLVRSTADRDRTPEQRARRDAIERAINDLRNKKAELTEGEYYRQLEIRLLELAPFYP
jgi:hypothetical protein